MSIIGRVDQDPLTRDRTKPHEQPMNLRRKTIQGGTILVGRQSLGIVLSVVGVLLVTRIIGPHEYGIYATALGIVMFLTNLGTLGLDVYLLRKTEEPTADEFDQVFTLLAAIALLATGGILALRTDIARLVRTPEVGPVIAILALGIPFDQLATPAIVKLDRALNFKRVAWMELVSQVSFYAIAVPLALRGAGVWAPVAGYLTQQVSLLGISYWGTGFRPGWHWESRLIRRMLGYGMSYSSSTWVWQLRELVNPLIVGRFAGAEAVAYVAVSIRIAGLLAFAKSVTWRVAIAALAKLGGDQDRLRRSISEGMRLQTIAVGIPIAGFALVAPFALPLVFGSRWNPALKVFPFIALSYLSNAVFNLHTSVLYLLHKNWNVTWFHTVHIVLFAGSAALLVPYLGFIGYGWAEIAALSSYFVLHRYLSQEIGSPSYSIAAMWYFIAALILGISSITGPVRYVGFLLMSLPLLLRREREDLAGYFSLFLSPRET
jgi:O-antigen/teichoic acid export membrane protein